MRLSTNRIEVIGLEIRYFSGDQVGLWRSAFRNSDAQHGFSLIELIVVMVIVGILSAVVAPRFFDVNVFKSHGFADQVQTSLRYAQKEAIAQHRNVCVALTAASISLTIANASGAASVCVLPLTVPSAASATPNQIFAPAGITMTYTSASFNFDALGRTPAQQIITISGNNIVAEAETGYVHSP